MGSDRTLEKALYKAFWKASYLHLPNFGNIVFTIAGDGKEEALQLAQPLPIGYGIWAAKGNSLLFWKYIARPSGRKNRQWW